MLLEQTLPKGKTLDNNRYRILNLVKSGGMGSVYKAEDICLDNRIVAIKEMIEDFSTPEERRACIDRFLSEIGVLEGFRHPNIPRVTNHFFESPYKDKEQNYYFVMEFIDGIDLSSYLKQNGSPGLPEKQVIEWAVQVCEALEYLHGMNPPIAHRDIKPSNLLYRYEDKRILIIDFGIARVTNPGEGYWIGTPGYAPPEQQMGRPEPRSDFYALGASMHELLTGQRPRDFYFQSFEELGVKVSSELAEFIGICLCENPEDRAVSAGEMKRYLLELLGHEPEVGPLSPDYLFEDIVHKFKTEKLDPELRKLIDKYGNEAETKYIPKRIDYFKFILRSSTAFELIIQVGYNDRRIHFYEKQGALDQKELGSLNPMAPLESGSVSSFIRKFTRDYEKFKSANWGGGEGFLGYGNFGGGGIIAGL